MLICPACRHELQATEELSSDDELVCTCCDRLWTVVPAEPMQLTESVQAEIGFTD